MSSSLELAMMWCHNRPPGNKVLPVLSIRNSLFTYWSNPSKCYTDQINILFANYIRFWLPYLLIQIPWKLFFFWFGNPKVPVHCNPVQGQYRTRTGFSLWRFPHRENPYSHCRDPYFHYRDFPVRKLHRDTPVFITGNGFAVHETSLLSTPGQLGLVLSP